MRTVIETPKFMELADDIWSEDDRLEFISFIAKTPEAGDIVPESKGARKVRWSMKGTGKSGGVRVIYFNLDEKGIVYLIYIYKKNEQENITGKNIQKIDK